MAPGTSEQPVVALRRANARATLRDMPLRLVLPLVLLLVTTLGMGPARAQQFVPGTEDVPLMRDLAPVKDSDIVFDKPEGRIIEASARGKVTKAAVRSFYASTLPQLGWKASGESWTRETETLHLDFAGHDGDLWVTFTLVPK
jgi:hypothetical protein